MKLTWIALPVFLLCVIIPGCEDQPVNEDKFIKVYTDLVIAQDTSERSLPLYEIKKIVFAKNRITEQDYNHTLRFYNENPGKWETFFDKAIAYLEKQRKK